MAGRDPLLPGLAGLRIPGAIRGVSHADRADSSGRFLPLDEKHRKRQGSISDLLLCGDPGTRFLRPANPIVRMAVSDHPAVDPAAVSHGWPRAAVGAAHSILSVDQLAWLLADWDGRIWHLRRRRPGGTKLGKDRRRALDGTAVAEASDGGRCLGSG